MPSTSFGTGIALLLLLFAPWSAGCAASSGAPIEEAQGSVFHARTFIEASYDQVWEHLTSAEGYERWWTCSALAFGDEPGDALLWGTEERLVYEGTLQHIEKGQGLAYTYRFVGFDFDEPFTLVEIDVLERGSSVLVQLRHDCRRAPKTSAIIGPVGWPKLIARLKTLLETGREMNWPDPEPTGS